MNNNVAKDYFEKNGYVVLSNALDEQTCDQLTQHMFNLHKEGKMINDQQCPSSDAIYGDPSFDKLLQDFAKPIGDQVGRELIPTYSYARIYRPGEILKRHKDRPSCEISATLTLGYDAKFLWPIYFDDEKEVSVGLEIGDLAVYKGTEVVHWRKPFKGEWHVQVFLHYVDANGPYKDHAFDGRGQLGTARDENPQLIEQQTNQNNNNVNTSQKQQNRYKDYLLPIFNGVIIPGGDGHLPGYVGINSESHRDLMFTKQECDQIVEYFEDAYPSAASVGGNDAPLLKREVRSAELYLIDNLPQYRWIFEKVSNIVGLVNANHFGYDLTGITHSLQLIKYDSAEKIPGHYDWHVDAGPGTSSTRKISLTIQLTDPDKYTGCDLEVIDHGGQIKATREQGSINLFPSYMPHRVTPIETGVRFALVIWIHGPWRFR